MNQAARDIWILSLIPIVPHPWAPSDRITSQKSSASRRILDTSGSVHMLATSEDRQELGGSTSSPWMFKTVFNALPGNFYSVVPCLSPSPHCKDTGLSPCLVLRRPSLTTSAYYLCSDENKCKINENSHAYSRRHQ